VKPTLYRLIEPAQELLSKLLFIIGQEIATAAMPTATAMANTTAVNTEETPLFLTLALVFGLIGLLRLGF
jgi:hypothetical protein